LNDILNVITIIVVLRIRLYVAYGLKSLKKNDSHAPAILTITLKQNKT